MSGLELMKQRMEYLGGNTSDGRIVRGKYKSFLSALDASYQAEWITIDDKKYRCLINTDKQSLDYDQKEISIDFSAGLSEGKTFYWDRTDSHWIVYLRKYEEEAYFRATIRQCDYQVEVNGKKYWTYTRGPVETALIWKQKHSVYTNDLNYSIILYIEKNEDTLEYFKRFRKIKFDEHNWQVVATDKYSSPGLIEVYLDEYYDNEMEDAAEEVEAPKPDVEQPHIEGPQSVRPYDSQVEYSVVGLTGGEFVVNSSKVIINNSTDSSCTLDIITGRSGNFILSYMVDGAAAAQLEVLIKSL